MTVARASEARRITDSSWNGAVASPHAEAPSILPQKELRAGFGQFVAVHLAVGLANRRAQAVLRRDRRHADAQAEVGGKGGAGTLLVERGLQAGRFGSRLLLAARQQQQELVASPADRVVRLADLAFEAGCRSSTAPRHRGRVPACR